MIKRTLSAVLVLTISSHLCAQQSQHPQTLHALRQLRERINQQRDERIQKFVKENKSKLASYHASKDFLLVDISQSGIPIFRSALNAGAAATTGAARLQSGAVGVDLEGENMTVGIWDDGLVKNHIELGNRILSKEGTSETLHIEHVTGTILATGINPLAKGMAPKANATTWYFDNDEAEMAMLSKPDQTGLLFSNHSYGTPTGWYRSGPTWVWSGDAHVSKDEDYRFGFYDERAQTLDQLAYLAPYHTIVWAAGNDRTEVGDGTRPPDCNGGSGYDCIIPDAVGKNVITVGAVGKVTTYSDPASVAMSPFSSWGPTDDGRIKPDLVGAGIGLLSLSNAGVDQYTFLSGTSMATPNVTGSLLLIQELYNKLHGGKFMRSSTLKGLAIHTAKEAGPGPGPDYSFGWGLLDVEAAAKTLIQEDNQSIFIKELTLENGQTYSQDVYSKANQKMTVTICWTDPAGTPVNASLDPTNPMLVNDLDIRITDAAGKIQQPWTLDPFSPSSKATPGDNFRDNVEKIEFNNPEAKKYTITVNHKGILQSKQDFALIVTHQSSLPSGNTYYWVGGTGPWSDGSHWSTSSGGSPANTTPGINDNVIVDENSFDGIAAGMIDFSANAFCNRFLWITDKPAGLGLNTHRLKIQNDFSISGKNFTIATKGILEFNGLSDHEVNVHSGNLLNASLEFTNGNWTLSGDIDVDKIHVNNGALTMSGLVCSVKELNALDNTALTISGSLIDSLTTSSLAHNVTLTSDSARIRIEEPAQFTWDNIQYAGEIDIINGSLQLNSTASISALHAMAGTSLSALNGTTQTFSVLQLDGTTGSKVSLLSPGKATFNFASHEKFCFDNLNITNIDVSGTAVANVGPASTLTNSNNWLAQSCQDIIFPDFDEHSRCQNSMTEFVNKSSGKITSWSWDFGDEGSVGNNTTIQNPKHQFSKAGQYTVVLTVSDGITPRSYAKQVEISEDDRMENSVIFNGSLLFSLHESGSYQWYKDGISVDGATARNFNFAGAAGRYTVVTAGDDSCNLVSSPFIVTGLESPDQVVEVFPNPARDFVTVRIAPASADKIIIYDIMGHPVYQKGDVISEASIDVGNFTEGVYIVEISSSSAVYKRKIMVRR